MQMQVTLTCILLFFLPIRSYAHGDPAILYEIAAWAIANIYAVAVILFCIENRYMSKAIGIMPIIFSAALVVYWAFTLPFEDNVFVVNGSMTVQALLALIVAKILRGKYRR